MYELGQQFGITVAQENVNGFRSANPSFIRRMREKLDVYKRQEDTFIAADGISLHVAKENNYKLRVSYPSPGFTPIANHLPLCGEYGTDFVVEEIYNYFRMLRG